MTVDDRRTPRSKPRQAMADSCAGRPGEQDDDTQLVVALSRGLKILDAFGRADSALGNAELAERTGLTRPTVSRLAYTLAQHGYLHFDARRREYRLGIAAITLGSVAMMMTNVRIIAVPLMRELASGSHFNVGLGTRDGHQMVYTDTCEGDALIALRLFPGSRVPLVTSAMGRAFLTTLSSAERERLLAELRPRHEGDWALALKGVEAALDDVAQFGFCASIGAWQKDINGVGVPIAAMAGQPQYVFNLGGPAYALPEAQLRENLGPKLVAIARTVEAILAGGEGGAARPDETARPKGHVASTTSR
jgi:DNA-binding IclR family transcriptional regulator